jgi:hypothetical protein
MAHLKRSNIGKKNKLLGFVEKAGKAKVMLKIIWKVLKLSYIFVENAV